MEQAFQRHVARLEMPLQPTLRLGGHRWPKGRHPYNADREILRTGGCHMLEDENGSKIRGDVNSSYLMVGMYGEGPAYHSKHKATRIKAPEIPPKYYICQLCLRPGHWQYDCNVAERNLDMDFQELQLSHAQWKSSQK
eukprot:767594-Hanusia_phi.AAC.13